MAPALARPLRSCEAPCSVGTKWPQPEGRGATASSPATHSLWGEEPQSALRQPSRAEISLWMVEVMRDIAAQTAQDAGTAGAALLGKCYCQLCLHFLGCFIIPRVMHSCPSYGSDPKAASHSGSLHGLGSCLWKSARALCSQDSCLWLFAPVNSSAARHTPGTESW